MENLSGGTIATIWVSCSFSIDRGKIEFSFFGGWGVRKNIFSETAFGSNLVLVCVKFMLTSNVS